MNVETLQSSFFANNRQQLKALFSGHAPIVLTANGLLQRSNDTTFTFKQDPNFWYLTGINEPDLILVIDRLREYIIVPDRSDSRKAFDGIVDIELLRKTSGIEDILDEKTGWKRLGSKLKKSHHVATLAAPATYVGEHGFYPNPAKRLLVDRIKSINDNVELLDLRPHMAKMRMIKQPEELLEIERAITITGAALKEVKKKLSTYTYEYQVAAAITNVFGMHAADHAYAPIVAAGGNACTLHYVANGGPVQQDDLLLLDIGAESNGYAADISRTFAVGDSPTKRQEQVWQAVIDVQEHAMDILKPGVTYKQYEQQVESFMGEKLRELGLIKTITHEAVRKYYPHATSHFLGLDVHDIGEYDQPFEAGMVLTVEPGIYIAEENIGIRIEDDVLLEVNGIRNLSADLSRSL